MTNQQAAELACEWAGMWRPGQKCDEVSCLLHGFTPHDIPCPDVLHDKAKAMELLIAMRATVIYHTENGIWSVAADDQQDWEKADWGEHENLLAAIVHAAAALAKKERAR